MTSSDPEPVDSAVMWRPSLGSSGPLSDSQPWLLPVGLSLELGGHEFVSQDAYHTVGTVRSAAVALLQSRDARHWAPFAGCASPSEIVLRLKDLLNISQGMHQQDVGQAARQYSLNAHFVDDTFGLDTGDMVALVRSVAWEDCYWKGPDGEVHHERVRARDFDRACLSLVEWCDAQVGD